MRGRPIRRRKRPLGKKQKMLRNVALGLLLLLTGLILLDFKLRPAIIEIVGAELNSAISEELNYVCAENAASGKMSYNDLVNLQYNEDGKLIGLTTDMKELNELNESITNGVTAKLKDLDQTKITFPFGSISGLAIFSGLGPSIPVKVLSVGRMSSKFESSFHAAGINQTEHQIQLVISVDVMLLLPGGTCKCNCTDRVTVAESILMGDVPSNYSYFSQFGSASDASSAYHDYAVESE